MSKKLKKIFQKLNNSPTKANISPQKILNWIDFAQRFAQTSDFLEIKLKISEIQEILGKKSSILE